MMPVIKLAYTKNLADSADWTRLSIQVHNVLVKLAQADMADCKTLIHELEHFVVGESGDGAGTGFVILEIALLEGRSPEARQKIGSASHALVQEALSHTAGSGVQLRVEVREIDPDFYFCT